MKKYNEQCPTNERQTMRVETTGVCRGNWKIYQQLKIEGIHKGSSVTAQAATDDNRRSPLSLLKFRDNSCDSNSYVLVVPDPDARTIKIEFSEIGQDGRTLSSDSLSLNCKNIKWESRLNYKIKPDMCSKLRNYDDVSEFDMATIDFWQCIEDSSDYILRCTVRTPYRSDSQIKLRCFDRTLNEVNLSIVNFGSNVTSVGFTSEKKQLETQLSIRMPKAFDRYYFVIDDQNHPSFSAFDCLTPDKLGLLLEETNFLFTHAQFDPEYPEWFTEHKATIGALEKQRKIVFNSAPKFSIIVPLYNTPISFFNDMTESVKNQSYANWELILVNASPDNQELKVHVEQETAHDNRINSINLTENKGISENTNAGVAIASGDFVSFFDHDDILEPDLLFSYAEAIENNDDVDLLYCDEDKLMPDGKLAQPFFKPDFNIDLLRNNNYICHMLTIRKSLLDTLEPNTKEFDGAQDHNLTLRAVEKARKVHHVPKVLYHWRLSETSTAANADSKPYATIAGIKAVQSHLDRLGLNAKVEQARRPFTYKVTYAVPDSHPLVSIIIPTKDHANILDNCIKSIVEKSTYDNFELVIIENNSTEKETFDYYDKLQAKYPDIVRLVTWKHEFNFSKLMNFGVAHAKGDYLLLLNNDTEVITPNWIETMLGICAREDVGAVGAKLYYPDNTIQHAGLCVTGGVAGHLCQSMPRDNWGYFALNDAQQDFSAVTAACIMTKRDEYEKVGGFTEELQVAFNDVDFCLKLREINDLIVYTPEVELYHYESISRGVENNTEKQIRFHKEVAYMNYRWAKYYVKGDPYMNPNFTVGEPANRYYHL